MMNTYQSWLTKWDARIFKQLWNNVLRATKSVLSKYYSKYKQEWDQVKASPEFTLWVYKTKELNNKNHRITSWIVMTSANEFYVAP